MYQKGQDRTTCARNHKNITQKISEKMDYPKKRKQETCTAALTHRESPRSCWNVEASRKWTNYRAKQNMKTDQRHPQKKLEFTKLRVRVRAGVPQQWFLGPRGVKSYPPMIIVYLRGTLLLENMSSLKRRVDSRWASLKRGRLYARSKYPTQLAKDEFRRIPRSHIRRFFILWYIQGSPSGCVCDVKSRGWRRLMKRDPKEAQQQSQLIIFMLEKTWSKKQHERSSCWLTTSNWW